MNSRRRTESKEEELLLGSDTDLESGPGGRPGPQLPASPARAALAALFLGSSLLTTAVSLILTNQRVPPGLGPLPDLLLDRVERLPAGLRVSETLLVASLLLSSLVTIAHTHRLIIFRRVFFISGLLYYYRALTMQVTVLPSPDPDWICPRHNGTLDLATVLSKLYTITVGGGISLGEQQPFCGDYIYSGHTVIFTLAHLALRQCEFSTAAFSKTHSLHMMRNKLSILMCPAADTPGRWFLLHWLSLALSLAGVLALLLGRGHYTIGTTTIHPWIVGNAVKRYKDIKVGMSMSQNG